MTYHCVSQLNKMNVIKPAFQYTVNYTGKTVWFLRTSTNNVSVLTEHNPITGTEQRQPDKYRIDYRPEISSKGQI